jgi:NAD(P)H dehydrogenase (quinone)
LTTNRHQRLKETTMTNHLSATSPVTSRKPIRNVLVHGANGVQGGAIARQLRDEGFTVRGAVRNPARSEGLRAAGIEIVTADLDSPGALLEASRGVDAVVLTLPLEWNAATVLRWTRNAVTAAREAAVDLLVFNTSARVPERPSEVSGFEMRRAAAAMVREAGVPSIILHPPFYLENLASPWCAGGIVRDRVLAYPVPAGLRVSWLAVADLGAYVAAALRRPDLAGQALAIGGPETLDGPGLARALGPAVGHPIGYVAIPPAAFEQGLAVQFGPVVARGIAESYHWIAAHATTPLLTGAAAELAQSLARPLLTVTEWARTQTWRAAA